MLEGKRSCAQEEASENTETRPGLSEAGWHALVVHDHTADDVGYILGPSRVVVAAAGGGVPDVARPPKPRGMHAESTVNYDDFRWSTGPLVRVVLPEGGTVGPFDDDETGFHIDGPVLTELSAGTAGDFVRHRANMVRLKEAIELPEPYRVLLLLPLLLLLSLRNSCNKADMDCYWTCGVQYGSLGKKVACRMSNLT